MDYDVHDAKKVMHKELGSSRGECPELTQTWVSKQARSNRAWASVKPKLFWCFGEDDWQHSILEPKNPRLVSVGPRTQNTVNLELSVLWHKSSVGPKDSNL